MAATKKKTKAKKAARPKKRAKPRPSKRASKVLSPGEAPSWRVENAKGEGRGLIICDHASNRVPRALKDLGLGKADLRKHIGIDIGAEEISRQLSRALDMPAVLATYSRLVVDLNRAPSYHECMPAISDGISIPGNASLSREQKERRLKEIFWPYQNKVGKIVDGMVRKKQVPLLIAIHSFTPAMQGKKRPWHIGILWSKEEKIAKRVISSIRRSHPDFLVGENEPYTLFDERHEGSTIHRHAEERGLPYVFVEFRQDLVDTKEKALKWAGIFLDALRPVLDDPAYFEDRKIRPRKK